MMTSKWILTGSAMVALMVPSLALAQTGDGYPSPEDFFLNQYLQNMEEGTERVNSRHVDELVKRRQERVAAEREATMKAAAPQEPTESSSSDDTVTTDDSDDETVTDTSDTETDDDNTFSLTKSEMRAVLRLRENQAYAWMGGYAGQQPTHQAAPLASTGMASNITVAVILLATGWTVWRARNAKTW